ncbi:MAG: sugar-binding domain-containing protein, partial [Spirochaetota bacterium]
LEKARRVDVALVGIGYPDKSSSMVLAGYFRKDDLRDLLKYHVVGDICTRFFDGMGAVPPIALNDRVIGIELGALREIDNVIGVAGGPQKVRAILGALRAGFLKSLITDSVTAAAILHEI